MGGIKFDPDRVIQFDLPTGAGETVTGLIARLRTLGPGWSWEVASISSFGASGVYTFDDGGRPRKKPFLSTRWHNRGDGTALVQLRCESEVLWEVGVFFQLLDDIVSIWPETMADIDRSLGVDEEQVESVLPVQEAEWKKYGIQKRRWERWERIRLNHLPGGLTQEQMAEMEDRDISQIKADLKKMREIGLIPPLKT